MEIPPNVKLVMDAIAALAAQVKTLDDKVEKIRKGLYEEFDRDEFLD